jgi:cysteine desulfurase
MSEKHGPVYLDYNATTPIDSAVIEAMMPFLTPEFGNPSSGHVYGAKPRDAVEKARMQVADFLGTQPENIVFTSGGTESNNTVLLGVARGHRSRGKHIITTVIEHPSVLEACSALETDGYEITRLPVDNVGCVDPEQIENAIRPDTILISIMHANNETGTVQPVEEITRIAGAHGVPVHTDAAQSAGKIPVSVDTLGIDFLSLAGHKLYAPKGTGVLFVRGNISLPRFMYGGSQEKGFRAGTENVPGIVGLGEACRIAEENLDHIFEKTAETRDLLYDMISQHCDVVVNGDPVHRLPNTLNLSFRGVTSNRMIELTADSVAVSAGSACHASEVSLSPVIRAIGTDPSYAPGTIRFSTGKHTTPDDIKRAAHAVIRAYKRAVGQG